MFCSGCGHAIAPGQPVCPQCGRPTTVQIPMVPNLEFQVANYANRVRALSTVWFIYGGLGLVLGFIGLQFANSFMNGGFGPWMHGPWSHGPAIIHFAWVMLILRSGLAFAAGWGLMHREPWGRVVALVAAFLCVFKIPFGTALGIWTMVTLLGYRNSTLYDRL